MLLFYQGIFWGAVIGVVAGVCTILYDIWLLIVGEDGEPHAENEEDDVKSSAPP